MYKVFTSLWSKLPQSSVLSSSSTTTTTTTTAANQSVSDTSVDEDGWVLVSDIGSASKVISPNHDHNSSISMTNSWIASPPLIRTDQSPSNNRSSPASHTHHFNPIENLLIEHASMSVYEQIATRIRPKRQRKMLHDRKLDEQVEGDNEGDDDDDEEEEEEDDDEDDDDDGRSSVVLQYPSQHSNISSIHHRNTNISLTNSSVSTMESSTSSLVAHRRRLNRIHQCRRRSARNSSKLIHSTSSNEKSFNKLIERQRANHARLPKFVLHQPSRSNH